MSTVEKNENNAVEKDFCDFDNFIEITDETVGNTIILSRRWCFTLNNYSSEEISQFLNLKSKYKIIFGYEVGKEKQTPHLQGYIEHKHQISSKTLKNWNKRVSWHKCKGNKISNIAYCLKDENFESNFTDAEHEKARDYNRKKNNKNIIKQCQHEVENHLRAKAICEMHYMIKKRGFDPAMVEFLLRPPDNKSDWTIEEKLGIKLS